MGTNTDVLKKISEAVDESILLGEGYASIKRDDLKGRIAVIANALDRGASLEETNEQLENEGFERLYARSFDESVLIFAICNHLSFEAWQALDKKCREQFSDKLSVNMSNLLNGTLKREKLKEYLDHESAGSGNLTGILTSLMSKELEECRTEEELYHYLSNHIKDFSDTREKARYYFCKYLNEYIEDKSDRYLKACRTGSKRGELLALEDLSFLKPLTELKREAELNKNKLSFEEKESLLKDTNVVPGGIFDEFSYYYGYISVDWIELIFERFGSPEEWDDDLKADIIEVLGYRDEEAEEKLKALEKEIIEREAKLDMEYSRESGTDRKKLYQRYRAGENYFRAFLNGSRDINRETLIAFILFISKKMELKGAMKVDAARMNNILDNCGFKQLKPKDNEFDRFIIEFLNSKTPFIVMEERVDEQIMQGKNFDFYKVYSKAYSHTNEIQKFMDKQEKQEEKETSPTNGYVIEGAVYTDKGNIRENNEDNFYLGGSHKEDVAVSHLEMGMEIQMSGERDYFTCAVFDGVGGTEAGEEASLAAAKALKGHDGEFLSDQMEEYFLDANDQICTMIDTRKIGHMGTTAVVLHICGEAVTVGNIGDSRAYLYRPDSGELRRLTKDQTRAQQLIDAGVFTEEEMEDSRQRHVLSQHLGVAEEEFIIEPEITKGLQLQKGDLFLLCSDGLTDMVKDKDLLAMIEQHEEEEAGSICTLLAKQALGNGGLDNVTIEVLRIRN